MKKIICAITLILFLISCSSARVKREALPQVQGGEAPAKLAILPVNNLTNDVVGGFVLRNLIFKKLGSVYKDYLILPQEETDEILNEEGITDGGQLQFINNEELCKILDVDGLLFVNLDIIELKTFPFYHTRNVSTTYKLYNKNTLVWANPVDIENKIIDTGGIIKTLNDPKEGLKDAAVSMAVQVGAKIAMATLLEHELRPEIEQNIQAMLTGIPYGNAYNKKYLIKIGAIVEEVKEATTGATIRISVNSNNNQRNNNTNNTSLSVEVSGENNNNTNENEINSVSFEFSVSGDENTSSAAIKFTVDGDEDTNSASVGVSVNEGNNNNNSRNTATTRIKVKSKQNNNTNTTSATISVEME